MKKTLYALVIALAVIGVASAGCGGSAPYRDGADVVEPERENPIELESEQTTRVEELEEQLASPEVDCDRVCGLGDAICDLSARICGIADRHPNDDDVRRRCTDSSSRCDVSRERIAASCECPAS